MLAKPERTRGQKAVNEKRQRMMFDWILLMVLVTLAIWMFTMLSGCVIVLKKDAEVGFRFGTDLALYHRAPDDGAEASVDLFPWVQAEIVARREAEEAADAETTPDTEPAVD